jgi:hypothetical protein
MLFWLLLGASAPASAAERDTSRKPARGSQTRQKASRASRAQPAPKVEEPADDSDALGELDDEATPSPAPAPKPAKVTLPPAEPQESESQEDESTPAASAEATADAASESDAPAPETDTSEGGPSIVIRPFGGVGISTRQNRIPTKEGAREIAPKVVPAAEVGLQVVLWPEDAFSFGINLVYQSAIGYAVTERAPTALDKEVRARSERVALDFAPTWRLGGLQLGAALGATIRTLWPEVHMSLTKGYSLIGPHARIDLGITLGKALSLHLSPEIQSILSIDKELREAGVSSVGVALGGDAAANLQLSPVWEVAINYRESHAMLSSTRGASFLDVERYLTLRVIGSF